MPLPTPSRTRRVACSLPGRFAGRRPASARLLSLALLASATLAIAACAERPTAVTPRPPIDADTGPLASTQAPSHCTRSWVGGTDGEWGDSMRWNPVGIPATSDTVCILAPGQYTISVRRLGNRFFGDVIISGLLVGDGIVSPTVSFADTSYQHIRIFGWMTVRPGSRVVFGGPEQYAHADSIDNRGVMEVLDQGGPTLNLVFRRLVNAGALLLRGRTLAAPQLPFDARFVNLGDIEVSHPSAVIRVVNSPLAPEEGSFVHAGGVIRGSFPLQLDRRPIRDEISSATFVWGAGRIETIPGSGGQSALQVTGFTIDLDDVQPNAGQLDVLGKPGNIMVVSGDVPPGVGVSIGGDSATFILGAVGALTPVIRGTLALDGATNTVSASSLVNLHRLELLDSLAVAVDSLENRGTIELRAPLRFTRTNARLLNAGSILSAGAGGAVQMSPTTTFLAAPAGRLSAPLVLDHATLSGDGAVGAVTSLGGTIAPGTSTFGALTATSLSLDPGSNVRIDVAGESASQYDRIAVTGDLTLGGKLIVTAIPPFLGGSCGQAIRFLTDASTTPRGAFGQILGLTFLGTPREWRVHATTGAHVLTGFNPFVPFTFSTTPTVLREGRGPVVLHACLGRDAPQAPVTVTLASALGQASATPTVGTFTTADWALPLAFSIQAIDDAVVERTMQDTLRTTLASGDPYYNARWVPSPTIDVQDDDGNADLAVVFDDAADTLTVGDSTGFRVLITNHGPTAITGGAFTLPTLTGLTVVSVTGPAGCTWSATRIDCPIEPLATSATQVITIRVRATSVGTHPTRVRIASDQPDPVAANDAATWTFVVR